MFIDGADTFAIVPIERIKTAIVIFAQYDSLKNEVTMLNELLKNRQQVVDNYILQANINKNLVDNYKKALIEHQNIEVLQDKRVLDAYNKAKKYKLQRNVSVLAGAVILIAIIL